MDTWRYIRMLMENLRERTPQEDKVYGRTTDFQDLKPLKGFTYDEWSDAAKRTADQAGLEYDPVTSAYFDENYYQSDQIPFYQSHRGEYVNKFTGQITSPTYQGAVLTPDDPFDPEWKELQAFLADKDPEKKKTKKLKKPSRGHSRYGRGGGAIPMDILESKTAPRGLLGPRKRKY
jgi:hypothetical protein